MNDKTSKVFASSKILILWHKTKNCHTAWVPWWQLQVWGQWDREQMPRLWILPLKPAKSEHEPQEEALILEQDGMVGGSPNSVWGRPGAGAAGLVNWPGLPKTPPHSSNSATFPFLCRYFKDSDGRYFGGVYHILEGWGVGRIWHVSGLYLEAFPSQLCSGCWVSG